jgi:hypothetical protein
MKTIMLIACLLFITIAVKAQQVAVTPTLEEVNLRLTKAGNRLSGASTSLLCGVVVGALGGVLLGQEKETRTIGYVALGMGGLLIINGYIQIGKSGKILMGTGKRK